MRSGTELLELAGERIAPGTMQRLELPVARLITQTQMGLPVVVVHGSGPGPTGATGRSGRSGSGAAPASTSARWAPTW